MNASGDITREQMILNAPCCLRFVSLFTQMRLFFFVFQQVQISFLSHWTWKSLLALQWLLHYSTLSLWIVFSKIEQKPYLQYYSLDGYLLWPSYFYTKHWLFHQAPFTLIKQHALKDVMRKFKLHLKLKRWDTFKDVANTGVTSIKQCNFITDSIWHFFHFIYQNCHQLHLTHKRLGELTQRGKSGLALNSTYFLFAFHKTQLCFHLSKIQPCFLENIF